MIGRVAGWALAAGAVAAVLLVALLAAGAWFLSSPRPAAIGAPPADLALEAVRIQSAPGVVLSGWFAPGRPDRPGILLMHGLGANRKSMMGRLRWLNAEGYSVLAFDFRGHGESGGDRITFGRMESLDAAVALAWLRERLPGRPIGAIGVSLGGAAALLGDRPLPVDALVLESVYPTIEAAVANRLGLRLGGLGRVLASLLVRVAQPIVGVQRTLLRPIDRIGALQVPLLIVAGTDDTRTTIAQSRALYAAAYQPKALWQIEGADHVDFDRYAGEAYRRRILAFFDDAL